MSKYVVLRVSENNPYLGKMHLKLYELLLHTNTKFPNNEPYFSSIVNSKSCLSHSVEKNQIAQLLKLGQNHISSFGHKKYSKKKGKIFVLKLNSQKLKEIISLMK